MTAKDLVGVLKDNPLDDALKEEVRANADELMEYLDELDHKVATLVLENSQKQVPERFKNMIEK